MNWSVGFYTPGTLRAAMQQQTWGNGHLPFLAVGRVKERAGKASDVPYGGDAVAMGAKINSFMILELHLFLKS